MLSDQEVLDKIMEQEIPVQLAEEILSFAKVYQVKSQEKVLEVDQRSQKVFFILEGAFVSQYYDRETENFRTINFHLYDFQPFMVVPENYFRNQPSPCQLKSVHPSTILEMRKADMQSLFEQNPLFTELYFDRLIDILMFENQLRIQLISQKSDMLYKQLIEVYPMIVKHIPSKYIAEFLGISQEWLSKLKRKI